MSAAVELPVDPAALRAQVREKYREVAVDPSRPFHFHTGRELARRLGYDDRIVTALPDRAVESFAGVADPFRLRRLAAGERVVDVGSGAGFDSFVAAAQVGPTGRVVGVDMTPEMLAKATATAAALGLTLVEFRKGLAEALPVEDGWADVVISNGVVNLCADKRAVLSEMRRVLRPGGWLQLADIANGRPVPESAPSRLPLTPAPVPGGHARARMGAVADTPDDVRAVLDAEDRRYRAMTEGDLAALEDLLAPEVCYTHSSGSRDTREDYLGKLRSGYYVYRRAEHPVDRVEVSGDAAIVVGRMTADVDVDGVPKRIDSLALAVWTRTRGRWQLLAYAPTPPPA